MTFLSDFILARNKTTKNRNKTPKSSIYTNNYY